LEERRSPKSCVTGSSPVASPQTRSKQPLGILSQTRFFVYILQSHGLALELVQSALLHKKCTCAGCGKEVSCTKGQSRRGLEMAPFTATQCREWTLLGCVVGCYPWSCGNVDAKGAPVTLLLLAVLRHTPDVRFYPLAAVGMPLDHVVLTGLGHTNHLPSFVDLRSHGPREVSCTGLAP
jgi:hypothetical protein